MEETLQLLNQETRNKILRLLKIEGPQTVDDLCEALELSSMGVRQHLLYLEGEGFLSHHSEKRSGVGRPSYVYSLADRGDELFPRSYAQLAVDLLDTIHSLDGEVGVDRIFEELIEKTGAQYRVPIAGKELEDQVSELANLRSEEGYMADWKQRDEDTFILVEHNCAVLQAACNCSKVCDYEEELFRRILDSAEVSRVSHIVSGDRKCAYVIQRRQ